MPWLTSKTVCFDLIYYICNLLWASSGTFLIHRHIKGVVGLKSTSIRLTLTHYSNLIVISPEKMLFLHTIFVQEDDFTPLGGEQIHPHFGHGLWVSLIRCRVMWGGDIGLRLWQPYPTHTPCTGTIFTSPFMTLTSFNDYKL